MNIMKLSGKRAVIVAIAATVMVCALVGTLLFMYAPRPDPARAEVKSVVELIGAHIVLPQGEEPTVATVSSLEQLEGQPFFENAKVGHKVLIYTKAKKAILYDPVIDKVVEVAPLSTQ